MANSKTAVTVDNVYQYNTLRDIVSDQPFTGTLEVNTAIQTSAMPRKRAATEELLSDAPSAAVSGVEKGAHCAIENLPQSAPIAKRILPGATAVGGINDALNSGQHVLAGNGAEAATEGMGVAGQGGGAWLGAEIGGSLFGGAYPPSAPLGALIGGSIGAYFGGKKVKAIGRFLTGGDTPDLLVPPTPIPNNATLEPTITTAQGDRYVLAKVDGHYSWYSIVDNRDLMLPNRYVGVMSGAKIAELTGTYLQAAGYEALLQERIEHIVEQTRRQTQELHRHNEIAQQNQPEITATHIKQGRAPDGSEIGKVYRSSEASGSSIWIRDTKSHHFIYVGTTGIDEKAQSIELYHDGKTGELLGGKIYTPDAHGNHTVTPFGELPPATGHDTKPAINRKLSLEDTDDHVKHLQLAHAFINNPLAAAIKHPELASTYVAQTIVLQGVENARLPSGQHAIVSARIEENAINSIARGDTHPLQVQMEHVQHSETQYT